MGMNAQAYDFTLTPFGSVEMAVSGSMLKVLEALGKVIVTTDAGAMVTCEAGQGVKNHDFGRIRLTDKSGSANKGFILVGNADMIDDRVTGEVSVIEGGKVRTEAGRAFTAVMVCNGGGGFYPHCQVWNPAGSAKKMMISQMMVGASIAGVWGGYIHATQLSTAAGFGSSKMSGVPDTVFESKIEPRANLAYGTGQYIGGSYTAAGGTVVYRPAEPLVILPGYGAMIHSNALSSILTASFDGYWEAM